jgi:hypothetical protein
MTLFDIPPKQRRRRRPETREVYDAVWRLRRWGRSVYRAGPNHHVVDGYRMSTARLLMFAKGA